MCKQDVKMSQERHKILQRDIHEGDGNNGKSIIHASPTI